MDCRACELMQLAEIKIQNGFLATPPKENKLNKIRAFYRDNGCLDEPIIINEDNVLVDGFTRYLVAKENHLIFVPIDRIDSAKTFEFVGGYMVKSNGKLNKNKLYWFINKKHLSLHKGDRVIVQCSGLGGRKFYSQMQVVCLKLSNHHEKRQPVVSIVPQDTKAGGQNG